MPTEGKADFYNIWHSATHSRPKTTANISGSYVCFAIIYRYHKQTQTPFYSINTTYKIHPDRTLITDTEIAQQTEHYST
jgi:hypothetical protein